MRVGKGFALGFLFAGMCAAPSESAMPPGGAATDYSTWVREDLPSPGGTGDAPLAGSLGPPEHMVQPVFPGPATLTREGSGGPPVRTGPVEGPVERIQLQGPDSDAWRGPAERRGKAKEEAE